MPVHRADDEAAIVTTLPPAANLRPRNQTLPFTPLTQADRAEARSIFHQVREAAALCVFSTDREAKPAPFDGTVTYILDRFLARGARHDGVMSLIDVLITITAF